MFREAAVVVAVASMNRIVGGWKSLHKSMVAKS